MMQRWHSNLHRDNSTRSIYATWNNATLVINIRTVIVINFLSTMPYHGVFGLLIPLLVAILQVFDEDTRKLSFKKHPANMWAFLVATLVYYFAFAADMKSKLPHTSRFCHAAYWSELFNAIAIISGSLSLATLLSFFLPCSLGYIVYVPWAFVSTLFILHKNATSIKSAYNWLYQKINGNGSNMMKKPRFPV